MTQRWSLPLLLGAVLSTLAACASTTGGSQSTSGAGDAAARSEVQIIDGVTYTATWHNRPSTEVRLAYDSSMPVSDVEAQEIAELITGCTAVAGTLNPLLVGGLASVRIPMTCGASAAETA